MFYYFQRTVLRAKGRPFWEQQQRARGCGTGKGAFDINSLIGFLCLSSPCLVWIRGVGFVWWWSFISFFFLFSYLFLTFLRMEDRMRKFSMFRLAFRYIFFFMFFFVFALPNLCLLEFVKEPKSSEGHGRCWAWLVCFQQRAVFLCWGVGFGMWT